MGAVELGLVFPRPDPKVIDLLTFLTASLFDSVILLCSALLYTINSTHLYSRDGGYETSPPLGKYCGTDLPPEIISHGNKLWIKFVSDIFGTRTGFSAEWDGTSAGKLTTLSMKPLHTS